MEISKSDMIRMSAAEWKFWDFHFKNPHVYEWFARFSHQAFKAGHDHTSQWLIANRVRWETYIKTTDQEFKLPNEMIAFYARLFMNDNPTMRGFFTVKAMKYPVVTKCLRVGETK